MKSTKYISIFLLIFILLSSFVGCSQSKPLKFTCKEMSITLTDSFKETSFEGFTVCYDSPDAAVLVLQESFDYMDGLEDLTLEQYRDLVSSANPDTEITPVQIEGMYCMEHTYYDSKAKENYSYLSFTYKSEEAFWLIQFSCSTEKYEELKPTFISWAKTVTFD